MMIAGHNVPLPETPQAKFLTWAGLVAVGAVSGWIFLTTFFMVRSEAVAAENAMKAEYTTLAANNAKDTAAIKSQIEYSADQNAKRAIENELFRIEQIPPNQLKPQDRALRSKLERDRKEIVDVWIQRQRPLR